MYDVAVIGAGPVGMLLGCQLASLGLDITVLEARTSRTVHSRAIGIHPPSLAALSRLGIAGELIRGGVRVRRGILRSRGRDVGAVTFEKASAVFPYVLTVPQYVTEDVLGRTLRTAAPGALTRGFPVRTVAAADDHVEIGGPGGVVVRAQFAVAADGAKSTVRAASGLGLRTVDLTDTYLMGDFADTTRDGPRAVIHVEPDGVVESFPLPGRQRRWVVRTPGLFDRAEPGELSELIRARTGTSVDPATVAVLSAFRARSRLATGMVFGRIIAIGDAAHEISPIGGQGMNLGWLDACDLAPVLASIIRRGRARDDDPDRTRRLLARFSRRRMHSARVADRQARLNMALGRQLSGGQLAMRDFALRAALATPVRTAMARAFTMRGL
ncbi:FAD-dependent oxidoreductase [Spelaeicoccus albus]|uniref:2-polyprenyl-6-methoxyphenol hydroxylase-like FAD-dependent oxidoreductase n=1 Tax=Spelaeicoccus albus TaxID=1280376 RepID=A0A7Z0D4T1_9MICO|nr:NAD(P)/FAD-dependent oxidoreductase [Spelaeicoccus albus]NYI68882.1 2-polyprenyl-6-methoxyphenol hydroxylase-like FAD-dependent oxidoreductase [Spelaeicoccus albus]